MIGDSLKAIHPLEKKLSRRKTVILKNINFKWRRPCLEPEMTIDIQNDECFGFWEYDYLKEQFYFSDRAASILDIDAGNSLYFEIPSLMPQFRSDFKKFYHEALVMLVSTQVSFGLKNSTGPARWIQCKSSWDGERKIVKGILQDSSKSKRLDDASRIKIALGNKTETITNTGSFEWNLSEDHLLCSDNFFSIAQIQGHNHNSQLDKSVFYSLIEPEQRNFVLEVMHECITANQEFEVTFFTSNSARKKLKMYGYPDGDHAVKKLVGVVADISGHTQSEASIIRGQDLERKRLSLELHDSVGQKLVAVKYMLALAKITQDTTGFDQMSESMDSVIEEIRTITHNLSTQIVKEVGLEKSIDQILGESAKALSAETDFNYDLPDELDISPDMAKALYRIVQEALSNAMKYSKASLLTVDLRFRNKQLSLKICDNGVGFDQLKQEVEGIGIQNIKHRVSYLNGFLRIQSEKGQGTKYIIKIPL